MVELKGSLGGIGLPSIIQLIGELHHSGTLHLDEGELHAQLAFDDGRLVAAECGEQTGTSAVAVCGKELNDAEFKFVEGTPTLERTLDLSPPDARSLLNRVANGELGDLDILPAISNPAASELDAACRMLGFADDRDRHYSRPTALHRCYASGAPSLVSAQEQRDLCLSGRFATCPRYRNMEVVAVEPVKPVAQEPPRVLSRVAPVRPPALPRAPTRAPVVTEPRATSTAALDPPTPVPAVREPHVNGTETLRPETEATPTDSRGGRLVAAASIVVGLLIVVVAALMLVPRLTQRPVAAPSLSPVNAPARTVALVTEPTTVVAAGARATAVPVILPTATQPPRPTPTTAPTLAPTTAPSPTVGVGTKPLMDIRMAAGPPDDWVDNPPFAAWSDGAYRMEARQPASFVAVGVPTDAVLGDVVLSATFRKTGGPPGGGYGLIVRDQGPPPRDGLNQDVNAYVLETGDLGEFGIWRRDGDHWVDLVPWTRSNVVRPGGSPNDLSVRAVGDRMTFTVNGTELASVQDGKLLTGAVGVFVGGDYNEVALDHFTIQAPN